MQSQRAAFCCASLLAIWSSPSAFAQQQKNVDLTPHYNYRPETPSERLQNFKPPPPAPPSKSFQDYAKVPVAPNTTVRPDLVGPQRVPGVTVEHKFP